MKKTVLKDDNGKFVEVDLKVFVNHINHFHKIGTSIHDEHGHYFRVNDKFRKKLKRLNEKE